MEIEFGRKIKDLRLFYGISQKEVCKGICNQSYISKLEKGMVHPSANMLAMIADRLGVNPYYFFDDFADVTKVNYVYQVIEFISKNMDRAKYEAVLDMVEAEKQNPLFRGHHLQQFLLWRQGICVFHLHENHIKAIGLLDEAISLAETTEKNSSERELDILLSKAIIYSLTEQHQKAEDIYESLLQSCNKHPYLSNEELLLAVYYNFSKGKFLKGEYKSSFSLAKKGVKHCLDSNSLYILGELYFQCGKSLWYTDKKKKTSALNYLGKSRNVFLLRENEEFADLVQEEIDEIKAEAAGTETENIPE